MDKIARAFGMASAKQWPDDSREPPPLALHGSYLEHAPAWRRVGAAPDGDGGIHDLLNERPREEARLRMPRAQGGERAVEPSKNPPLPLLLGRDESPQCVQHLARVGHPLGERLARCRPARGPELVPDVAQHPLPLFAGQARFERVEHEAEEKSVRPPEQPVGGGGETVQRFGPPDARTLPARLYQPLPFKRREVGANRVRRQAEAGRQFACALVALSEQLHEPPGRAFQEAVVPGSHGEG